MAGHPPAGAAGPGVRLGHLRRRRLQPGPHDPHHGPDRHRHHAGADGAPHRRVALGGRAAAGDRRLRRGRASRNMLAVRGDPPGDPLGEWVAAPRGPDATPTSWCGWCAGSATSASAWRRSPTATRARPTPTPTSTRLLAKIRAGADFAISQLFLEPEGFLRLRDRLAAAGCDVPLLPGIMPLHHGAHPAPRAGAVRRAAAAPTLRRAAGAATPTTRRRSAPPGMDVTAELCARLLAEGVRGLHFYTLNRSTATAELVQRLGLGGAGARPACARSADRRADRRVAGAPRDAARPPRAASATTTPSPIVQFTARGRVGVGVGDHGVEVADLARGERPAHRARRRRRRWSRAPRRGS